MTSWQLAKKRGKNGQVNAEVAAELVHSLLSGSTARKKMDQKKQEWKCTSCGIHNFMDRQACRKCAKARNGKKPITGPLSQQAGPMPIGQAKLAPWAQMEATSTRRAPTCSTFVRNAAAVMLGRIARK